MTAIGRGFSKLLSQTIRGLQQVSITDRLIHTTAVANVGYQKPSGPRGWQRYNKKMYEPPQTPEEPIRPAVSYKKFLLILLLFAK